MPLKPAGSAIRIEFRPCLRASRGKLRSGDGGGIEVHAGTFLRERRVVLDSELTERPIELARILIHELYHFVWIRLGNRVRRSYEELLAGEIRQGERGELGWSAEHRKNSLRERDWNGRTRRWREYACESFCDTAAWLAAGGRHPEFTLGRECKAKRRAWFRHSEALCRIQL